MRLLQGFFKPGELAERSNAAVLKTASPQGLGGSDTSLSASRPAMHRGGEFLQVRHETGGGRERAVTARGASRGGARRRAQAPDLARMASAPPARPEDARSRGARGASRQRVLGVLPAARPDPGA